MDSDRYERSHQPPELLPLGRSSGSKDTLDTSHLLLFYFVLLLYVWHLVVGLTPQ